MSHMPVTDHAELQRKSFEIQTLKDTTERQSRDLALERRAALRNLVLSDLYQRPVHLH